MRRVLACGALAGALSLGLTACLPPDNRPVPASVLVTAEPSEATKHGFISDDGWEVKLDRVLLALGHVDLDDQDEGSVACTAYSETNYEWLYDFVQVEREKVGVVYGLGDCGVEYRVRGPDEESLVSTGATQADVARMSSAGSDAYVADERVTLRVVGSISRDDVVKSFDWSFRRSFEVSACATKEGEPLSRLALESEAEHTLRVEVRAEELFRAAPNDEAPFEVSRYADADVSGDGEIVFAELEAVPAPMEVLQQWPIEGLAEEDQPEAAPSSLTAVMYELLLPRVTRMAGGAACEAEVRGRR